MPPKIFMAGDETHDWFIFSGMECCRLCGIVRRADRQNSPCKGPVKVGPKSSTPTQE